MKDINKITTICLGSVAILFLFSIFNPTDDTGEDVTNMVEDAVYGTNQTENTPMKQMLSSIFELIQKESRSNYPNTYAFDNSDYLEISSYEGQDDLNRIINLLENSIEELNNSNTYEESTKKKIEDYILNSATFSEDEKIEMINSFKKTAYNTEKITLSRERIQTQIAYYENILSFYRFLKLHFNDYVIEPNENSERVLAFYTDQDINTANTHFNKIETSRQVFAQADEANLAYSQEMFNDLGFEIDSTELRNKLIE